MVFENRVFESEKDRNSSAVFENYIFKACMFDNCALSLTNQPSLRSTVRNVQLIDCKSFNSLVGPAVIEDTTVDGLAVNDLLIFEGSLFRHVTLKGKIGSIKITTRASFVDLSPKGQARFDAQRLAFYKDIDWALDIRDAAFSGFDCTGIPSSLVRRDPATQAVVRRDKISGTDWLARVASWNTYWPTILDMCLGSRDQEFILVAPKRKKGFRRLVDGLSDLRDIGVAEPD